MITLPGLIDMHVHLRDFNESDKEDFYTGTKAALSGGFTTVMDMPNNKPPITTLSLLQNKQKIAAQKIVCDTGFYFGTLGDNLSEFPKVQHLVSGLKVYLNETTGNYLVDAKIFEKICEAWPLNKLLFVHAEENILEAILTVARKTGNKIHVGHVSSQKELEIILNAQQKGMNLTCGVTPHHLFLTNDDQNKLGPYARMKPILKTKKDQQFLWDHLADIDCIESDHAPQSIQDKESPNPPYGVPGLETTLPVLLTAASEDKLTLSDIKRLCHDNPARILQLQTPDESSVEIDENKEWVIKNENLFTKCKWSPFNNWNVRGKVATVTIRGIKVFENENVTVNSGFGRILAW